MQRPVGKGEKSDCISHEILVRSQIHLMLYVIAASFEYQILGSALGKEQQPQITVNSSKTMTMLLGPEGMA